MKTDPKPLVSIITLNYNQTDITCEFLESTKLLTYDNYEILVVDMASKINPTEQIEKGNYPKTKIIVSDTNLGFTGGNNLGMRAAKGDYVFIVNNDTEVTNNLLELLLEPFFENPSIGVVSPKIRFFHHKNIIQYAGFQPINPFTGRTGAVGSKEEDNGQHNVSGFTHGAHGAAMMVKKEVIEAVGMFPEDFFIYYEEWDWSSRIIRAGYKIYYQAKGLIYHKESITMGKESAIKAYYHTRNRILYMRRNTNKFQKTVFMLFLITCIIPKSMLKYIKNQQFKHLQSFFSGVLWHLKAPKSTIQSN